MSQQDAFDRLPAGVQAHLEAEFHDTYLPEAFDQAKLDCYGDIMDGFLALPEVATLWDDYEAMLWRDFVREGEADHWTEFLAEMLVDPAPAESDLVPELVESAAERQLETMMAVIDRSAPLFQALADRPDQESAPATPALTPTWLTWTR